MTRTGALLTRADRPTTSALRYTVSVPESFSTPLTHRTGGHLNPTDFPTLMAIRIHTGQTTRGADNTAPRHVPGNPAYLKQMIGTHPMVMDRNT
jgi:hypothetical protein